MLSASDVKRGRPDALADVPGTPDLALTRAVVLYWDRQVIGSAGSHLDDIGVGLVLEGRYAASTSVLDLGSTRVRELDLSRELAVLGWVRQETLTHVLDLISATAEPTRPGALAGPYCFGLGLRVLGHLGFSSLTRPAFLRIGFRDVRRDVDADGRRGIRVDLGEDGVAAFSLDPDDVTLKVQVDRPRDPAHLEVALGRCFPGFPLRRAGLLPRGSSVLYEARLPLPRSVGETRELMRQIRGGLTRLVARFEPARHEELARGLETFGARDTLLRFHPASAASAALLEPQPLVDTPLTVH